jgi:hypothetical protein
VLGGLRLGHAPLLASFCGPPGRPAPSEIRPEPVPAAAIAPDGVVEEATEIGNRGWLQGAKWRRASRSSNQSVFIVTGPSQASSATMAARLSSIRRRWSFASMPIMVGVAHQRAGPAAQHDPPARHVVELHEALRHEEGMVIGQARHAAAQADVAGASGAAPIITSGEAMVSQPAEWCSPIQASS